MSIISFLLLNIAFIGPLSTPSCAEQLELNDGRELFLPEVILSPAEKELLDLPDGLFVIERFVPQANLDSPLKDLDIIAYTLSNGQEGYVHIGKMVPHSPDPKSEGISIKVDFDTLTYFARKLEFHEILSVKAQIESAAGLKTRHEWTAPVQEEETLSTPLEQLSLSLLNFLVPPAFAMTTQPTTTHQVSVTSTLGGTALALTATAVRSTWFTTHPLGVESAVGDCGGLINGSPTLNWEQTSCPPVTTLTTPMINAPLTALARQWGHYENQAPDETTVSDRAEVHGYLGGNWKPVTCCYPSGPFASSMGCLEIKDIFLAHRRIASY